MTIRKQMKDAKEMPNTRGMEEDIFFVGETMCRTALTWQKESIARVRATETYRAAAHAGVFMSVEEVNAQEKWERILLSLEGLVIPNK